MKFLLHYSQQPIVQDIYNTIANTFPSHILYPQQSIYNILDNNAPDCFVCESQYITPILTDAIQEYNLSTILIGNPISSIPQYKLLCTSFPNQTMLPMPTYHLRPGANVNILLYELEPFNVLYISDKIQPSILSQISTLTANNIQVKVVGQHKIPCVEYIGQINIIDRLSLCKAAKLVILDDITYMYDVAISKKPCLIAQPNDIYPVLESDIIKQIKHLLSDEKHMSIMGKNAYKIAKNNTYYHRVCDIFKHAGFLSEAELCQQKLLKILE